MLYNRPPGYSGMLTGQPPGTVSGASNRQTVPAIGNPTPGPPGGQQQYGMGTGQLLGQTPLGGLGQNSLGSGGLGQNTPGLGPNFGQQSAMSSMTSPSMTTPQNATASKPPTMTPWANSQNQSTLLRVLLGKTT